MSKRARLEFKVKSEQDEVVMKAFSLSARESMVRSAWYQAFKRRYEYAVGNDMDDVWVKDVLDDAVIVRWDSRLLSYPYEIDDEMEIVFGEPVAVQVMYQAVGEGGKGVGVGKDGSVGVWGYGSVGEGNYLKVVGEDEGELRVGNYMVLWGGPGQRDLEGLGSRRINADGSRGEYFTPETEFKSMYTETGRLLMDFDHGLGLTGDGNDVPAPNRDDILGWVDWKTAAMDERGLWVERVLNRRNMYMGWLEALIRAKLIGTSSEPVSEKVQKAEDGKIEVFPLRRDTLTVSPMEWRMMTENPVVAKAIAGLLGELGQDAEPRPGASMGVLEADVGAPEDGVRMSEAEAKRMAAVVVARVKIINIQLEED